MARGFGMNEDKTIFIAIAAFNETDVISTIENCLENAAYPERLHFGLALHYSEMDRPVIHFKNTKTVDIAFGALWGVCPARALALNLYDEEDFYLQLDGHMKFDKNWDSYLIDVFYQAQKAGYQKPVFTGYVPWWVDNEDGEIEHYTPINDTCCGIMHYSEDINRTIPQQATRHIDWHGLGLEFVEHFGFSAHFVFADSQFIYDVPPDPAYMFYGEEPTTALRAWTRGYSLLVQRKATVWHKNKMPDSGKLHNRDRMLYDGYNQELRDHHLRKAKIGEIKAQMVMTGSLLGMWGAPSFKLYLDYVKACGFNFNEFYAKTMEHNLNNIENKRNLGYNQELIKKQKNRELRELEAREAKNAQSSNAR
jgi:hypothetical protein